MSLTFQALLHGVHSDGIPQDSLPAPSQSLGAAPQVPSVSLTFQALLHGVHDDGLPQDSSPASDSSFLPAHLLQAPALLQSLHSRSLPEAAVSASTSLGSLSQPDIPASASRLPTPGPEPMEFGEPLVYGPEAGVCTAAIIWLHGHGEKPKNWANYLKNVRRNTVQTWKWVHLRAHAVEQPCWNGKMVPAWGKMHSTECMHVGSRDHEDPDTEGFYRSATAGVRRVVEALMREDGVPEGQILIGGISQGAAVSLQAALTFPTLFAGCIVLSGWLTPHARMLLEMGAVGGSSVPSVLLCHGTDDTTVGYDCAKNIAVNLRMADVRFQFESFAGIGHSASPQEMKVVANFLLQQLGGGHGAASFDPRLDAAKVLSMDSRATPFIDWASCHKEPLISNAVGASNSRAAEKHDPKRPRIS